MTIEESRKYRRIQNTGIIMVASMIFLATYLYSTTQSWAAWAIISIVTIVIIVLSYRAAKMEVLSGLDISLPVYEQILGRKAARRRK